MRSIASEISKAVRFWVPLNIMCSIKCEMPFSFSLSKQEPVPTSTPMLTESSPSICLTTSRSPLGNRLL